MAFDDGKQGPDQTGGRWRLERGQPWGQLFLFHLGARRTLFLFGGRESQLADAKSGGGQDLLCSATHSHGRNEGPQRDRADGRGRGQNQTGKGPLDDMGGQVATSTGEAYLPFVRKPAVLNPSCPRIAMGKRRQSG